MLKIEPKYPQREYIYGGSGLYSLAANLIKRTANSTLAKKIINSSTTQGLKRAANSSVGKQLQSHLLQGAQNATQNALESGYSKLGLEPLKKRKRKSKKSKGTGIVLD